MTNEEQQAIEQQNKALQQITREQHGHRAYAQARFDLGKNYYKLGDVEKAILTLQTIQAKDYPELYAHAQFNIGNYYHELGFHENAIQMWQHVQPSHGELYAYAQLYLGNRYYELNHIEKAIESWQRVKYKDGKDVYINAVHAIANAYIHLNLFDETIELWKALIAEHPEDNDLMATAYFNLGNLYDDIKQYNDAIQAWSYIGDNHELYASSQFNIGNAYINLNRKAYAIDVWKNIKPEHGDIYHYTQGKINETQVKISQTTLNQSKELVQTAMPQVEPSVKATQDNAVKIEQYQTAQATQPASQSATQNIEKNIEKQQDNLSNELNQLSQDPANASADSKQQAYASLQAQVSTILNTLRIDENNPLEQQVFLNIANSSIIDELKQPYFKLYPVQEQHDLMKNSALLDFFAVHGLDNVSLFNHQQMIFVKPFLFNSSATIQSHQPSIYTALHVPLLTQVANKEKQLPHIQLYRCIYFDPTTHYIALAQRDKWSFYQTLATFKPRDEIEQLYQQYQQELNVKQEQIYQSLRQLKRMMQQIYNQAPTPETLNLFAVAIAPLFSLIQYPNSVNQQCHLCCFTAWNHPQIQTTTQSTAVFVPAPTRLTASLREVHIPRDARDIYPFMLQLFEGQTHRIQHLP